MQPHPSLTYTRGNPLPGNHSECQDHLLTPLTICTGFMVCTASVQWWPCICPVVSDTLGITSAFPSISLAASFRTPLNHHHFSPHAGPARPMLHRQSLQPSLPDSSGDCLSSLPTPLNSLRHYQTDLWVVEVSVSVFPPCTTTPHGDGLTSCSAGLSIVPLPATATNSPCSHDCLSSLKTPLDSLNAWFPDSLLVSVPLR